MKRIFSLFIVYALIVNTGYSQPLHLMGQKFNKRVVAITPIKQDAKPFIDDMPSNYSQKEYAPQVTSQPYGNCYAYASAYTARTILYNITVNETANPTKNSFSTGFIERLIFGNRRRKCRNSGADTFEACRLMQDIGVVFRNDYPSDCSGQEIDAVLKSKAAIYKVTYNSLFKFCSPAATKVQNVKTSLFNNRAVVIGINSVGSFHANSGDPDIWVPTQNEKSAANCNKANHAVCIIGYDDSKYGGAFEIQNSWGTDWKGDGRIWIKYDDLALFMSFAIELSNP